MFCGLLLLLFGLHGASLVAQWYSPANVGDAGSNPGLGRSPREENGKPLQYSCLGNPMDRGAWQATHHGFAKSDHLVMVVVV